MELGNAGSGEKDVCGAVLNLSPEDFMGLESIPGRLYVFGLDLELRGLEPVFDMVSKV